MPTFKELHTKWKEAKKEVKMAWDHLDRMTADFGAAHKEVKFALVRYPAFSKGMGPALDSLHDLTTKKDVKEKDLPKHKEAIKKQKGIVTEAVKQYNSDVSSLQKSREGVKIPAKNGKNDKAVENLDTVVKAANIFLKKMTEVLTGIDVELNKVKV